MQVSIPTSTVGLTSLKVTGSAALAAASLSGVGSVQVSLAGNIVLISGSATGGGGTTTNTYLSIPPVRFVLDGLGSVITPGQKKASNYYPSSSSGTISKVTLLGVSTETGSIVIDVLKNAYAGLPLTTNNSICGLGIKPNITNSFKSQNAVLTGWSTSVTGGDVFGINVVSCSGLTWVGLTLDIS